MNLKTKKILAREFLAFSICILITLLTLGTTYIIDKLRYNDVNKQIAEKLIKSKELTQTYIKKENNQKKFTRFYTDKFKLPKNIYSNQQVWKRLSSIAVNDSVEYKWRKVWNKELMSFNKELGYKTPNDFKNFILINMFTPNDSINYKKNKLINEEIDELKYKLNNHILIKKEERVHIVFLAICITFTLLFLIRYFYYGIKWSLKTLKQ